MFITLQNCFRRCSKNSCWFLKLNLLLLLLSSYSTTHAQLQSIVVNPEKLELSGTKLFYFKSDSGAYTPEGALDRLRLGKETIKGSSPILNLGLHKQTDAWMLLQLQNTTDQSFNAALLLDNLHLEKVHFYQAQANQPVLLAKSGDWIKKSEKEFSDPHPYALLPLTAQEQKQILVHIFKDQSSMRIPLYVGSSKALNQKLKQYQLRNGIYLGFLSLSLLLGLAFFTLLRDKLFLLYSAYVLTSGAYTMVNFGVALEFLYPENPMINDYLRAYMAVLNSMLFVIFSIHLLNIRHKIPLLYTCIMGAWGSMGIILILSIVFNTTAQHYFNPIYTLVYILMVVQVLGLLVAASILAKKVLIARFYLLAYFLLITGMCMLIFREVGITKDSWLTSNLGWAAMTLEVFVLIVALAYKVRSELLQKLQLSDLVVNQQKQLFTEFFQGREEERKLLAGTLHDGIAGNLLAAQYSVNEEQYPKLHTLLQDTFTEVRQLSHDLYPPNLREKGLQHLLEQFTDRYQSFSLSVNIEGNCERLTLEHQLLVFRIAQELLTNCSKHARASSVSLQLSCFQNHYSLLVSDNGIGMDNTNEFYEGIGLRSIRTRINAYPNARFSIAPNKDEGTQVYLCIPFS